MPNPSATTFGFELEYASQSRRMLPILREQGLLRNDDLHRYHCDCQDCMVLSGEVYVTARDRYEVKKAPDLHAQTDSTADGEFITRVLDDWDDLRTIVEGLTRAASQVEATTGPRCGLHVHVAAPPVVNGVDVPVALAYLAYERYFTEIIAPGRSQQKRDMNTTLMQAFRSYVVDNYYHPPGEPSGEAWKSLSRNDVRASLDNVIGRDRHVDLNRNSRYNTWEFRVFNATNAAWRIELATRLAVAFVAATPTLCEMVEMSVRGSSTWPVGCDSPWGEIARPAWSALPSPHPTKRPVVPMDAFVDALCVVDPDLRPLIERQRSYMRARYARMVS